MHELSIGYVLEGVRRGYNFTTPTDSLAPETLKAIWRSAMPRGQDWERYPNTTVLKCFTLDNGEAVQCEVSVIDMQDEVGRRGIRQAAIRVESSPEYRRDL